ncbi:MAG TPA: BTAD domain-containing putative transcriptional regulator [Longimicrobiales bacterium]|nr:BTAD domain-containing putative transcriptional regulator [Longimicrobiales bacterium]
MKAFKLRLLGGVELRDPEGVSVESLIRQPKRLTLLAHLALGSGDGFMRRDAIMALFWPDLDAERARHALRQSLYFLRRKLDDGVIETRGTEELRVDRDRLWCDVAVFEDALAADRLKDAQALYRGDLMDGLYAPDVSPQLEQIFEARRQRLRERAAAAAWELAERATAHGDPIEVHHWGRRAVELSPEVESAYRRLIQLLDWIGDGAAAVEVHKNLEERLESDLGIEPSPETTRLIQEVRQRRVRRNDGGFTPYAVPLHARVAADTEPGDDRAADLTMPAAEHVPLMAAGFVLVAVAVLILAMLMP